ncbi:DUF7594 domain-containing protein [Methanocrinis sp.]|uniref:CBM96 family carbohydrate-binding protein n=1 Tax=Methanocrinis sp. TaxID=3101522 RepID=UPI003D0C13CB
MFSLRSIFRLTCTLACAVLLIGAALAGTFAPKLLGDSYVDADAEDDNFGAEETLWVSSDDGEPVMVAYISFEQIVGSYSPDDIESATLRVYAKDVESPGEVELHFYYEGFYEDTVTWSDELGYEEGADGAIEVDEDEVWYDFDATEIVKKSILECESCPFSLVLVSADDATVGFASSDDPDENVPELKITTIDG